MELKLVVAIIPPLSLESVEKKLQEMGVRGVTAVRAKSFGAYANFLAREWLVDQVKIEIYAEQNRAESIAAAILDTAHTGSPGNGIVAILPVERIFSVRTKSGVIPNALRPSAPRE
ncbi:MAG: P-II family nitrogen regulator [Betaproteobacteria bacterium]|nr:P-II family nitrogen regulator [Betaproteobacteria bacterium]